MSLRHPSRYTLRPATLECIGWIAKLQQQVYGPVDAIPHAILEGWFQANPRGFTVLWSHDGRRVGHLDMLPLRPAFRDAFLRGDVLERELPPNALFGPHEQECVTTLYVESVALDLPPTETSAAALTAMLGAFVPLVHTVARERLERFYGIAASAEGSALMRHMGMTLFSPAHARRDAHDLFAADAAVVLARAQALYAHRASRGRPGT